MKNNLLILCAFLAVGCSVKDDLTEVFPSTGFTKSGLQSSSSKSGILVSQNQIPGILKGYLAKDTFPSIDKYTLKTVSEDGYNLIYVGPEAAFWLEATKRKIAEQIRANL